MVCVVPSIRVYTTLPSSHSISKRPSKRKSPIVNLNCIQYPQVPQCFWGSTRYPTSTLNTASLCHRIQEIEPAHARYLPRFDLLRDVSRVSGRDRDRVDRRRAIASSFDAALVYLGGDVLNSGVPRSFVNRAAY